jgi:hypothetical protein
MATSFVVSLFTCLVLLILTLCNGAGDLSIIACGASGVGKSFLSNILLGEDAFGHRMSAGSVTSVHEARSTKMGGKVVFIHNVPVFVESSAANIARNKEQIDMAFSSSNIQVVLAVFSLAVGGRISGEDMASFLAMDKAYKFNRESVVLVLNFEPTFDSQLEADEYRVDTTKYLTRLLNWSSANVVFVKDMADVVACAIDAGASGCSADTGVLTAAVSAYSELVYAINKAVPATYRQKNSILLTGDEIALAETAVRAQIDEIEKWRNVNKEERRQLVAEEIRRREVAERIQKDLLQQIERGREHERECEHGRGGGQGGFWGVVTSAARRLKFW